MVLSCDPLQGWRIYQDGTRMIDFILHLNTLIILYDASAVLFVLATFFIFIFTGNNFWHDTRRRFSWRSWSDVKAHIRERPIRLSLTIATFAIFFAVTGAYLIPVEITPLFALRSIFFRGPLVVAGLAILYASARVDTLEMRMKNEEYQRIKGEEIQEIKDKLRV